MTEANLELFEQYLALAQDIAPQIPEDDGERAAFMLKLEIPELTGVSTRDIRKAVFTGAAHVAQSLGRQGEPTDTTVTPFSPDSLELRNTPFDGWYLTELRGPTYHEGAAATDAADVTDEADVTSETDDLAFEEDVIPEADEAATPDEPPAKPARPPARRGMPEPVMLDEKGVLHVYERWEAPMNPALKGFVTRRYFTETSTPLNDRALLLAYALRVTAARL